jgi:alkylhydroperoxidase family enzyme
MTPRIPPGTAAEIGRLNTLLATGFGRTMGIAGLPNVFTTLARHRKLFWPWLLFAGRLMPRGTLPRADTELVILRVAHNSDNAYEWSHHERIGQAAGLSAGEVAGVRAGASAFNGRRALLLRAADELHERRDISDELWGSLREQLSEVELIELCMLVGHYEMLAMTLNSLRVEPDQFARGGRSRLAKLVGRGR